MADRSGSIPASEGQRRAVVGGYVPRQALSGSGKQLTRVYEDGGASPHPLARGGRTISFRNGIYAGRPARPVPIAYGTDYVAQHRGYTGVVRSLTVKNQLREPDKGVYDSFKSKKFTEGTPASVVPPKQEKNATRRSYKDIGRRAYKAEFKANKESRSNSAPRPLKPKI